MQSEKHMIDEIIDLYRNTLSIERKKEFKDELYYNVRFDSILRKSIKNMCGLVTAVLGNHFDDLNEELDIFVESFPKENNFIKELRKANLETDHNNELYCLHFQLDEFHIKNKLALLNKFLNKPLLILNGNLVEELKKYNEYYQIN